MLSLSYLLSVRMIQFIYAVILLFGLHFATAEDIECPEVKILGREVWEPVNNDSRARKIVNPHINVHMVVIHHTATNSCKTRDNCTAIIKKIKKYDMEVLGKSDIMMHFFIGGENEVFESRGWSVEDEMPNYLYAFNIAFIGNYSSEVINPKTLYVAQNLIQCGVKKKQISKEYKVYGHNDLGCTQCPGEKLYSMIKKWPTFNRVSDIDRGCKNISLLIT